VTPNGAFALDALLVLRGGNKKREEDHA